MLIKIRYPNTNTFSMIYYILYLLKLLARLPMHFFYICSFLTIGIPGTQ